ncbi:hypothetical protein WMF31_30275 [Sorangium sp. So ce1036]|uniref:hypothetical protein n=1 Tax=Sorangium sp. So ce1036 TaxID=3133328 RepID=UPI003F0F576E
MIGTLQAKLEYLRSKNIHKWLGGYARQRLENARAPRPSGPRHLLFAVCDHWEPGWENATPEVGDARVRAWSERYPEMAGAYRDADGRPPRHSFFFPGEQYTPGWLDALADLTRRGFGEVELHLHHHNDTLENLRADILRYLDILGKHGHFSRGADGRMRYGFIHGNWCLANSGRDSSNCGVDAELPLLFETGCYADYTFPSAPDESQHGIVNQIYWPTGNLARRGAHTVGERARVGEVLEDRILMIEGPLALALRRRGSRLRVRMEYGALQAIDPPTPERVKTWVDQNIHIEGRPEWVFVKVYAHGAPEDQAESLLGAGGHALHRELTTRYNDGKEWVLHYVTAREMYNIALAALEGKTGDPGDYRDHRLKPPPCAS